LQSTYRGNIDVSHMLEARNTVKLEFHSLSSKKLLGPGINKHAQIKKFF